jgi:hypothetical protein
MICRAKGCLGEAIVDLCGKHDEDREDGIKVVMKVGRPHKIKEPTPPKPPKVATLRPVRSRPACAFRTKKGAERCMNSAAVGSEFCGIHRKIMENAS